MGRDRVWETRYTPVRRGGEIVAVTAVVADATARKAAEAAQFKSEAQFRAICDASPIGIFLTDAVGGSLYSNPENLRQMGLTLEEAMGNGWQRAIHPDDFARVSEGFRAATQEGKTYATNARYLHAGGACVHVAVKARAIRDGETVLGYVGMVEDIGERLVSEAALRESELRFRQLADHIDDVFWLAGMDRVHYASPAFERVFGRPVADVYADVWVILEAVHPEDRPRVKAMMESVERDDIEYRIILPDGAVRWIRDRSFPIRDDRGRTVRKAGIATDITRQKALETQLLQTQKLDSIGRLAGGIAHDFNNLLTVILTQARMAGRAFAAGRSGAEELGQIEEAASRAADLTRQLLMFARRQPSHPVPLDLTEVTSGIEKLLRRVIGPNVELVARLDPNIGIVRGDRAQLEQVLVNLAVNARDAMPEGGTLTIDTVDVTREEAGRAPGPYVLLRVSDTGHGIAEADRAHVFDPFFTTKRHAGGTGLGLASCYGIVQQHGGEIAVESAPGGGATFCVYLPRIDATEPVVRDGGPSVPRMFGSETVLLVEDDALLRRSTSATLREHGFTVVEASSGEEALERLGDHDVDIVVSDVLMRGVDGRELAERLERERPALPILLTSGYSEGVGRFPFLAKPYVPATLVRRVREILDT